MSGMADSRAQIQEALPPAAAGDALFVRGERHLWCFADERVSAAP